MRIQRLDLPDQQLDRLLGRDEVNSEERTAGSCRPGHTTSQMPLLQEWLRADLRFDLAPRNQVGLRGLRSSSRPELPLPLRHVAPWAGGNVRLWGLPRGVE